MRAREPRLSPVDAKPSAEARNENTPAVKQPEPSRSSVAVRIEKAYRRLLAPSIPQPATPQPRGLNAAARAAIPAQANPVFLGATSKTPASGAPVGPSRSTAALRAHRASSRPKRTFRLGGVSAGPRVAGPGASLSRSLEDALDESPEVRALADTIDPYQVEVWAALTAAAGRWVIDARLTIGENQEKTVAAASIVSNEDNEALDDAARALVRRLATKLRSALSASQR